VDQTESDEVGMRDWLQHNFLNYSVTHHLECSWRHKMHDFFYTVQYTPLIL
jgi:hypothetical protein